MKEFFTYNLKFKSQEDVTEELEKGKKTITTKEVEKPVRVIIKEQSRQEITNSNNVYEEEWSSCIRRGILPRALISKTYRSGDGILTSDEVKVLDEINKKIEEIKEKYQEVNSKEEKSEEDNKEIEKLAAEFAWANAQLNSLEDVSESLFRHSAETLSFEKQLMYNILFLSYLEATPGQIVPLLEGETMDEKLASFDKILDVDEKSSFAAKEKARLYDEVIALNTEILKQYFTGKIQKTDLDQIKKNIENPAANLEAENTK